MSLPFHLQRWRNVLHLKCIVKNPPPPYLLGIMYILLGVIYICFLCIVESSLWIWITFQRKYFFCLVCLCCIIAAATQLYWSFTGNLHVHAVPGSHHVLILMSCYHSRLGGLPAFLWEFLWPYPDERIVPASSCYKRVVTIYLIWFCELIWNI